MCGRVYVGSLTEKVEKGINNLAKNPKQLGLVCPSEGSPTKSQNNCWDQNDTLDI